MTLQHLRSSTANKRPTPAAMSDGQLAMNTNLASPGLFLKDSNGDLVKVGPVHVGTTAPNATPAVGGQAGNSKGEQWLDTTGGVYVFKIYDGTAWRSETGTFVDVNGDTMTGALGIIAGSAAAPSLFFSGDTNTGIYSPGADQIAVATNGTGRLVIDANGTVTCTSAQPTDGSIRISNTTTRAPSNKYGIRFADSASETNAAIYAEQASSGNNASALVFGTNDGTGGGVLTSAAERLRITSAGNVGIGTSSPNYQLHVTTDFAVGASGFNQQLTFGNDTIQSLLLGTGYTALKLNPLGGNVGIGTTSPNALLDVRSATTWIGDGTTDAFLQFNQSATAANRWHIGAGSSNALIFYKGTYGTGVETARIDSSGRLLVGTSTAGTAKVSIQGATGNSTYAVEGLSVAVGGDVVNPNGRGVVADFSAGGVADGATTYGATINLGASSVGQFGIRIVPGPAFAISDYYPGGAYVGAANPPTERMRINQAGVAEFNKPGLLNTWLQVYNGNSSQDLAFVSSDNAGNEWHFGRKRADGYFYVVRQTGTGMYMNTNSWVATSDQRAKQNIADIESTIDAVKALKPSRFNWKTDGTADVGFIAQQVQTLIPEAVVDSGKPEAMLGITQDKLLPFVVKALQEAIAKIETLEARLTAAGIE